MAVAWTGVGVVVALFRDGAEEVGRQAEGIEGQAGLLGGGLGRTALRQSIGARVVTWQTPTAIETGRREHSRKTGGAPVRRPVRATRDDPMVVLGSGSSQAGILVSEPPRSRPTDRHNRRPPPPRQEPCHLVGAPRSTARRIGSPDPITPRPASRLVRTLLSPGGHTHRRRAPRGVPAGRRHERCRSDSSGAQRASSHSIVRLLALPILAAVVALGGLAANPAPAAAASVKVVVDRRPGRVEHRELHQEREALRAQARSYGATVKELYSPQRHVGQGQGRGRRREHRDLPRPRQRPSQPVRRVLRRSQGRVRTQQVRRHGNNNTKYYGEDYVKTLKLQKNAVVLLNRLCYASGNSEWGRANPTKSTAKKRVDNYGAGFLRSPARAVFANGIDSLSSIIRSAADDGPQTVGQIFQADPAWTGTRDFKFASTRTSGYTVWMDPYTPGRYYHSVVGNLSLTATPGARRRLTPAHPTPASDASPGPSGTRASDRRLSAAPGRRDGRGPARRSALGRLGRGPAVEQPGGDAADDDRPRRRGGRPSGRRRRSPNTPANSIEAMLGARHRRLERRPSPGHGRVRRRRSG